MALLSSLAAGLWFGVGHAIADGVSDQLQQIPPSSTTAIQLPTKEQPVAAGGQEPVATSGDTGIISSVPMAACPTDHLWFRADYLLWWTSGVRLPPLVTTSPQGTALADAGVLGKAGTTILFGDETVGTDARSGFQTNLGMSLDNWNIWSLEFEILLAGWAGERLPRDFDRRPHPRPTVF